MRSRALSVSFTMVVAWAASAGPAEAKPAAAAAQPPWAVRRAQAELEMLRGTVPSFKAAHDQHRDTHGVPRLVRLRNRWDNVQGGAWLTSVASIPTMAVGAATGHADIGGGAAVVEFWGGVGLMMVAANRSTAASDKLTLAEDSALKDTLKATWPSLMETSRMIFREAGWHP